MRGSTQLMAWRTSGHGQLPRRRRSGRRRRECAGPTPPPEWIHRRSGSDGDTGRLQDAGRGASWRRGKMPVQHVGQPGASRQSPRRQCAPSDSRTKRMRTWILAIGGSALVSCSQSPSDAGPPVGAVTCPSGVALTNTQAASLPVVDWKGGALPRCEPRCGVGTPEMGFPPASAIPTGVCVKDAATCGIGARLACKDGLGGGPVNGYACSCVDGRWSCVIVQQGGAMCSGGLFAD